jgi:hypothetical protein
MRRIITLASTLGALLGAALMPAPAFADRADCSKKLERDYSAYWHAVAHKARDGKLRKDAQGRNIRKWGYELRKSAKRDWRPARCRELRTSLVQLKRLQNPPRYAPLIVRAAVPPPQEPAGVATASVAPSGTLSSIAQCESGGNPRAVSPDGTYTGLYQFDDQTWRSVGGTGRAGDAPAAEQHQRAAALYAQRGGSPWPVCSR